MTEEEDLRTFEAVRRRMAGIDGLIKDAPALHVSQAAVVRRGGGGATSPKAAQIAGVGFALVLVSLVALGVQVARTSSPAATQPSSSDRAVGLGLAHLDIRVVRETAPAPSGIIIAPVAGFTNTLLRISDSAGREIGVWSELGAGRAFDLDAGRYEVDAWGVIVRDNVDKGTRSTSTPLDSCSTTVTLTEGTTTVLAIHVKGSGPCVFDPPEVAH